MNGQRLRLRALFSLAPLAAVATLSGHALAQQAAPAAPDPATPAAPASGATAALPAADTGSEAGAVPAAATANGVEVVPPKAPERQETIVPKTALPPPPGRATFTADPVADGAIVLLATGFSGMLQLINGTGEVRPQQISQNFDRNQLLGIDRGAVSQTIDPNASTLSNVPLYFAGAFALLDPILTGVREKSVQSALVDAIMYGESIAVTWGITNLAKMAVRRPRPLAYIEAEANKGDPNYSNADTDSALSFFSGHASAAAAIGSTATYLAFARSPGTARPWITLVAATALTSFVSYERVRAGKHFPTDVIAGAIAGAGVGVIVPHLHRTEDVKQRPVWVGFAPAGQGQGQGGTVQLSGFF